MLRRSFSCKGIPFSAEIYDPETIDFVGNCFQVLDDDIFSVTYPKSGSNWMQEILTLIWQQGDPSWSLSVPIWERIPWLDLSENMEKLKAAKPPRLISSHLPIQLFPKSFWGSKAKVIYTVRNPKDLLVSLYHFSKLANFLEEPESLEELLGAFLQGEVLFGSWFDHVKGWLGLRGRENFFCISYEELQEVGQDGEGRSQRGQRT
nr:sulfotransferase family cytosolic 2B member 1-like [Pelodiscus sinensis]|eukprot:XP_006115860.1 sulfotransferase family cytosolic 2B member 1-like [Pelodiscus sinensis]